MVHNGGHTRRETIHARFVFGTLGRLLHTLLTNMSLRLNPPLQHSNLHHFPSAFSESNGCSQSTTPVSGQTKEVVSGTTTTLACG
jgi:hypothetical protein